MFVTVPDLDLLTTLSSETLLLGRWGDAARDVMLLVEFLRFAGPALADVLALGLLVLAAGTGLVLGYRRATVTALGRRADGSEVLSRTPQALGEIVRLELVQVRITEPALVAAR